MGKSVTKNMRKLIHLLLIISLLAGCSKLRIKRTPEPTSTDLPNTQCAWNWATQALPELSARVEANMRAGGLTDITARAEAYGENCINSAGKVDSFAALETDFHIIAKVGDLTNKDNLGNLLEKILRVLDAFSTGEIPGSEPGYINVSFQAGSDELNIMFTVTAGKSARALGVHGAALLDVLQDIKKLP
jgi:hypothetical protein